MKIFSTVYKENYSLVLWHVRKTVRDAELAKDLTQSTFAKAFEKWNTFNEEKSKVSTWLITIAKNLVIDHFRQKENKITQAIVRELCSMDLNEEMSSTFQINTIKADKRNNPDEILYKNELSLKIVNYLRTLPALKRRIGLYRVFYDRELIDIAKQLNVPEGTVKVYWSNVKYSLQNLIS